MLVFSPKRDWKPKNWCSYLWYRLQLYMNFTFMLIHSAGFGSSAISVQYCTGCNSPSPLLQFFFTFYFSNFYFFLLLTFFLTFFNQWLRLKVAFYNYQSQPSIVIAPGAIPWVLHRIQIPLSLSCLVKICSLMTMGFLIVSLLSSLGFHYLILNFEIQTFVTVSG